MKNLTAIFCVVMFGCAAVAGATGALTMTVTTASAADSLSLGISETITPNVAQDWHGNWVNEIDVRMTSIGGTWGDGANTIPSTAGVSGIAGLWTIVGGSAYFPSSTSSGAKTGASNPTNQAAVAGFTGIGDATGDYTPTVANANYPGYFEFSGRETTMNFDGNGGGSPSFALTGAPGGANSYTYLASTIQGQWTTSFTNCDITAADATPGGTWSAPGGEPTGYGFDNTLLGVFYVTPSTQYVTFYTTDGNPWNVNNSTGGFGQFQFGYGGGRTSYVEIGPPTATPEPATAVLLATGLVGLLAYAWKKRK